jgi:serine/threonine protein kinase
MKRKSDETSSASGPAPANGRPEEETNTLPPSAADSRTRDEANALPPAAPTIPGADDIPPPLANHPRYRVLGLLGSGGMGAVYRAEHRLMQRTVALKVINPSLTGSGGAAERFRREVVAAAKLSHPNIVAAFDAEQAGDLHFLAMELVEGMSLSELLQRRGRLLVADACRHVRQAALGLQHAHEKGMVHRDIKPQNLMLTPQGQVKILDFGLARFVSETPTVGGLTQAGSAMGTPDYMAPEQARDARSADIRADIYSLGCTLYHLLTGQRPFPEGDGLQKVMAHISKTPRPATELRPDVPPELGGIVEKMMAKDPAQRYQKPAEVAAALAPFARPAAAPAAKRPPVEPPTVPAAPAVSAPSAPARRRWPCVAVALFLLLALAGGVAAVAVCLPSLRDNGLARLGLTPPGPPDTPPASEPSSAKTPTPRQLHWPPGKTPAPDLSRVKPLVRYDFSDSHGPWGLRPSGAQVEHGYVGSRYFMKATQRINHFEGRGERYTNLAAEAVGRFKGPGLAAWGMTLVGGTDEHPLLMVIRIGRKELHVFQRRSEAEVGDPVPDETIAHPALKPLDEFNRLLVILRGRQLEVYVNGVAACDPVLVPAALSPAQVRLSVHFPPKGGEAEFERLTIWPADSLPTPEARGAVVR